MEKLQLLYEGKAKKLFKTNADNIVWVEYKDSATAFNGEKKAIIAGKGRLNNEISSKLFTILKDAGLNSHFIKKISNTEQLVEKVEIVPLEVVVRNIVAGSMAKRLGLTEGLQMKKPLVEFYLKDDDLGDPIITEDHIDLLEVATAEEVSQLKEMALQVNNILKDYFLSCDVRLVDFKLEFGRLSNGTLILADEISPDTCRLWDLQTNEKFDKDVFRRDLGSLTDAYEKVLQRLGGNSACTK
ncbi:phosphoribosylaminoimidazolesuccinocarboxamide synthase [Bacillus sp. HMF5848]|uniref:phosphoribosylaminoimidazolesuccinocarboxamide synthase n=1 Tax=Bacillus sp. HMF5848 TaxID=2495421 RepID=UPI000F77ACAA|nr:phosphoribosylaminoimidazolesuccinocarboxamide synthase [Bacillus sp. HMF5848]RSK25749.1 phosphoribosylaminoimidazolesuccinocarboxamide synthase [Bacillus sp. HMF5848]